MIDKFYSPHFPSLFIYYIHSVNPFNTLNQLILNINGSSFLDLIITCDNIVGNVPINTRLNSNNSIYTSPILPIGTYNFKISVKDSLGNLIFCNIVSKIVEALSPKTRFLEDVLALLAIILGSMFGFMFLCMIHRFYRSKNNSPLSH
jgi:hypothetical protein